MIEERKKKKKKKTNKLSVFVQKKNPIRENGSVGMVKSILEHS